MEAYKLTGTVNSLKAVEYGVTASGPKMLETTTLSVLERTSDAIWMMKN